VYPEERDAMPFDTRRSNRHVVTADIRVVDEHGAQAELVTTNISRTGIGTDGLMQIAAGQSATVQLPDGTVITGVAVWQDDFFGGLLFEEELTEEEYERVLRSLASRPQFPR
jgi:hypothetical protein